MRKTWSVNALSVELARDRRTIGRALDRAGIQPDAEGAYFMADAVRALQPPKPRHVLRDEEWRSAAACAVRTLLEAVSGVWAEGEGLQPVLALAELLENQPRAVCARLLERWLIAHAWQQELDPTVETQDDIGAPDFGALTDEQAAELLDELRDNRGVCYWDLRDRFELLESDRNWPWLRAVAGRPEQSKPRRARGRKLELPHDPGAL